MLSFHNIFKYMIFQSYYLRNRFVLAVIYISLTGGQSLKRINHEREARMIYPLTTDRQTVIYFATNHCQCGFISILTHTKK